jgi:hypothetical protein
MTELFNFLNAQSGDRLFGYSIVFLLALYIVFTGISGIIWSIRKPKIVYKKQEKEEK